MTDRAGPHEPLTDMDGLRAIERVIAAHPGVAGDVALIWEDEHGYEQVVVYAVPATGSRVPTPVQLRAHVAAQLPGYAVPDEVVLLEQLPLTAAGEVDHAALPEPRLAGAGSRSPRTPQQELLCELFASVLDVGGIGLDDDFFELGGHSFLATRLVTRIRSVMDVGLGVRDLFEAPTVRGLAERMSGRPEPRPAVERMERPERLPVNEEQRRIWLAERESGGGASPLRLAVALRLAGPLDRSALEAALGDVLRRHEALRTRIRESDGSLHQAIVDPARARLPLTRVAAAVEGLADAMEEASARPFDVAEDLPVRAVLFDLGSEEHVLLLLLHRAACDEWSIAIVERDLARAYTARRAGRPPVWELLPVQQADHALWHGSLLGNEADPGSLAARQLAYWRGALANLPDELALPVDRPRPHVSRRCRGAVSVEIAAELHAHLLGAARQNRATILMVLLAGLSALLARVGAGSTIPVGVPADGRAEGALEDVVGCFGNLLLLRVDVPDGATYGDLVAQVRETVLEAYAHMDLPFGRVAHALHGDRPLSRRPLPQVSMTLRTSWGDELEFPGLTVTEEPVRSRASDRDLHLALWQSLDQEREPRGIRGWLEYDAELFDPSTAERIAGRLIRLLETIATNPELPVDGSGDGR